MNSTGIPAEFRQVQDQASRYLIARYGESVWFRAPETFDNVLERWIWCLASGELDFAETCITQIEEFLGSGDGT